MKPCPECNAPLYDHPDFTQWCPACDWNLQPDAEQNSAQNIFELYYLKLSERLGLELFQALKTQNLANTMHLKKLSTGVKLFSIGVIIAYLSLIFTGIYLLWHFRGQVVGSLFGLMFLGFAFLATPKRQAPPYAGQTVLDANTLPAFFSLLKLCANVLNTPQPDGVIFTPEFNASVTVYQKKRYLSIGLPLWNVLNSEEKLALLGHEIGHLAHNDPMQQRLPEFAMNVLFQTGDALCPHSLAPHYEGKLFYEDRIALNFTEILLIPFNWLLALIAHGFWGLGHLLLRWLWADSQRAEYRTDLNSLRLASLRACLTGFEKFSLEPEIYAVARQRIRKKQTENPGSLFEETLTHWQKMPFSEHERRRRILEKEKHRVDSTHPTTALRMEMLKFQAEYIQRHDLPEINWKAIENELEPHLAQQALALLEAERSALYR
ncbi:hypothetical protein COW36_06900 [bacterium (Candidatus Blackallbacteria) CG17_big_fil_post_rev_8_21_14_2_50_48_46]|uniref:Peptidase M48 domain-containing protein n=1 Tax=bacterium (Candidatus Blackallbacteria) CG17_big_fil_post_rev_8_21_14_2_50_48_46 TaxID=2014261 RepID=A0A2M7G7A0_9BACT|nr:MAG: hypothetical protein COW64_05380 [bacterium (Candidatus Blackallbacteria) CG18_big_fil_WC_8_21_14_2_50_49_26]PIW17924.1 MAG: hypothetical protein COW36_06900 [bacterium (Candidatus Blackallbacteria) CG17_big_fil_post_rev_8_21_14_2_50_48_46]PIW45743.1 MAG: hypothetical protein COW20_19080 [bacterium (Candidatus Blackallbacteria) CG13_big_fil_rev_8_21_14_2_50_49_14]